MYGNLRVGLQEIWTLWRDYEAPVCFSKGLVGPYFKKGSRVALDPWLARAHSIQLMWSWHGPSSVNEHPELGQWPRRADVTWYKCVVFSLREPRKQKWPEQFGLVNYDSDVVYLDFSQVARYHYCFIQDGLLDHLSLLLVALFWNWFISVVWAHDPGMMP